jgi:eukaryotic-like serine/threonine-protein kinase
MQFADGQKLGRYTIEHALGHGGMSNVYLAHDDQEDRKVVLKFPHEEMMGDIATYERFTREVKIGKLLTHPNVQGLYDLARVKNSEFLVLEYIDGITLREYLRRREKVMSDTDYTDAVDIGLQIANALAYAHAHHVAHRDLKPENVIITEAGQAKVMDFGIASLQGARRVTWGPLSNQVGTPDYMSPEQIQGGRGDSRTDVYALGMILYEFVAHRLPYDGDNALAVMNQHVTMKAPSLHFFRENVPAALEETIMKAIRRAPNDRWQSMGELVEALQNPSMIEVEQLKTDREQERGESPALGKLAHKVNIPVTTGNAMVLILIIILFVVLAIAVQVLSPHHR